MEVGGIGGREVLALRVLGCERHRCLALQTYAPRSIVQVDPLREVRSVDKTLLRGHLCGIAPQVCAVVVGRVCVEVQRQLLLTV